eukprot:953667-Amphidinium_carterae.2
MKFRICWLPIGLFKTRDHCVMRGGSQTLIESTEYMAILRIMLSLWSSKVRLRAAFARRTALQEEM